ncbi:MAG: hypothetical protein JJE36_03025 [Coriobacteriia bacterium]|nr:hypothetical protein [Coriobacteriia bacterium]
MIDRFYKTQIDPFFEGVDPNKGGGYGGTIGACMCAGNLQRGVQMEFVPHHQYGRKLCSEHETNVESWWINFGFSDPFDKRA